MDEVKQTIQRAEDRVAAEKRKGEIIETLSGVVISELRPALQEVVKQSKEAVKDYLQGIKDIRIEPPQVNVNVPDVIVPEIKLPNINIPEIKIPKIEVPKINIPEIKIPQIKIPEIKVPKIPKPEITINERPFPKEMEVKGIAGFFQRIEEVIKGLFNRDNPVPVILTDDKGSFYKAMMSVTGGGGSGRRVEVIKPSMVDVINVTMTNINTEYSTALPANTVAMTFQCRGDYDVRFSYQTGKVATPTAPYMTLKAGMIYYETNLDLTDKTLYVACGTAAQVVEVIAYH